MTKVTIVSKQLDNSISGILDMNMRSDGSNIFVTILGDGHTVKTRLKINDLISIKIEEKEKKNILEMFA